MIDSSNGFIFRNHLMSIMLAMPTEGEGLLGTRWWAVSSAYQSWQSIDQLNSWDSSTNMSPPAPPVYLWVTATGPMLIDESQLLNWSTALWDTIMDCQDLFAELKINHLVTGRTWPTDMLWHHYGWIWQEEWGQDSNCMDFMASMGQRPKVVELSNTYMNLGRD